MPNKSLFKQLAWAFYLACSWTWCIGMFLPVILQKDFGNGAWLIFIICNVVGATAFSFVINSPAQSRQFLARHASACALFSVITIAFQLFFIGWVFGFLSGIEIAATLMLVAVLLGVVHYTGASIAAVFLWGFSVMVMAAYMAWQPDAEVIEKVSRQFSEVNPQAFYALPILAFGFLLCPYLDITFHQVVQAAPTEEDQGNRLSFLIGFPVLFLTLMIFSLVYADSAGQLLLNPRELFVQHSFVIITLLIYFVMQAAFTAWVHWQAIQKIVSPKSSGITIGGIAVLFALAFFVPIPMNEMTYRIFMSFYGIIAPAYLWLVVFNNKRMSNNSVVVGTTLALLISAVPLFFQNTQYYFCYPIAVATLLGFRFFLTNRER